MNQTDRSRLARLYAALNEIPFPHDGGGQSTASIQGMATFQDEAPEEEP